MHLWVANSTARPLHSVYPHLRQSQPIHNPAHPPTPTKQTSDPTPIRATSKKPCHPETMPRPISEAQRAACQQNAQNSTGPRTATGKAKTRLNAYKHGLTAKLPLLPFESAEDFAALKDGFEADFAPQNTYQKFLTHQLATHAWRILRSQQVEIGLQQLLLKQIVHRLESQGHTTQKALAENPYAGLALTLQPQKNDPHNHLHRNLFRYSSQIQSDFHRTQRALKDALKQEESTTPGFVSSPQTPCAPSSLRPPFAHPPHNESSDDGCRNGLQAGRLWSNRRLFTNLPGATSAITAGYAILKRFAESCVSTLSPGASGANLKPKAGKPGKLRGFCYVRSS